MSRNRCVSVGCVCTSFTLLLALTAPVQAQVAPNPAGLPNANVQQQLDQILQEWHQSSRQVNVLNGEHRRYVYDYVFGAVKQAKGRFFYSAPDRGRIDLEPYKEGQGRKLSKTHPVTRSKVQMTVGADHAQRWICDGTQILQIDDTTKSGQQFPIPPEARGANIMDGPLPFLFGMPPEKAKARYSLVVVSANKDWIDLLVKPKLQKDTANYQWARVRIERATMLPAAVQIIDPTGNKETVYTFPKIEKNPKQGLMDKVAWWKEKDPFKPDLKGYDIQLASTTAPAPEQSAPANVQRPAGPQQGQKLVPSVIGLNYRDAQQVLTKTGFEVKFQRGDPAASKELVFRVQRQTPGEKVVARAGTVVWLTLYTDSVQQTSAASPALSRPEVPVVTGMQFRAAEKILRDAGYNVKFRRGIAARNAGEVFFSYDQIPKAGTALARGENVTLILFTKPEAK